MERITRPTVILWHIFFVAFLISCAAPEVPPPPAVKPISHVDTSHPQAKLVIGSDALLGNVVIRDPMLRTVGKMTQAQVTVENLTENEYLLEYKFDWADLEGFEVESRSVWHRFRLSPHEVRNFSSTGKTPDAKKIIFTVRFPHDVM